MSKSKVEAEEKGEAESDLEAALRDARVRVEANSLEAAEAAISQLRRDYPQDRRPVLLQGELFLRRGDLDDALELAEAELKEDPNSLDFHRLEISTLLEKQAYLEVLKRTLGSLRKYKFDADLVVYRCRAFLGLERMKQLKELADRGAAKYPSDRRFDAFREQEKQYKEAKSETFARNAENEIRKALQDCRASFASGRYEEAAKGAQAALDEHPDHYNLTLLLCRSLAKLDRNLETEEVAQRALAHHPGNKALTQFYCRALVRRGAFEAAVRVGRDGLGKHPGDYELSLLVCQSLMNLGRSLEVAEVAQRALEQVPGDRTLTRVKCAALIHRGAYEEANTEASAFLNANQQDPAFLVIKGQALLRLNRPQEYCREVAAPPLSDLKNSSGAIGIYSQCLERTGAWQAIIDYLEPGIKAGYPLPVGAQDALSAAYIKQGRKEDAESLYDSIVKAQGPQLSNDLSADIARARELFPLVLPNSEMSQTALDRLWSFADQGTWSRTEWTDRIRWGYSCQRVMMTLVMSRFKEAGTLMKLVEHCDLEPIEAEIAAGRSLVLTGGHVGAGPTVIAALVEREIPTVVLSRYATPESQLPGNVRCITASSHPLSTFRAIRDALSEPRVLVVAGDVDRDLDLSDSGYIVTLFGNDVVAQSMPPWLAHQNRLSTYWVQALFHGDRVRISSSKMLTPEPKKELKDAFAARWYDIYLRRFLGLLRAEPANLYMVNGPVFRALLDKPESMGSAKRLPIKLDIDAATL
ncbi:MAG: tetratricopeptide repeat protein [Kiloniellales bacterium]